MSELDDARQRFTERYEEGNVPWDEATPPPEIVALAAALPPGHALDLGCGYGRAAIYLAARGWSAVGVDFVPRAIDEARRRAAAAGVAGRAAFYVSSATDLSFLAPPFDLAIDVGCMHSFSDEMLADYRRELTRLLPPGSAFLLHVRLRQPDAAEEDGPRGIEEAKLRDLLARDFHLERFERGSTRVADRPPWASAWFWWRRV